MQMIAVFHKVLTEKNTGKLYENAVYLHRLHPFTDRLQFCSCLNMPNHSQQAQPTSFYHVTG
ncbi:MAG: hypothetical protein PSV18_13090, partial [Methylobacter sp.]|nr:hypothetical protein [Candidatus Methylobacter titanis]